MWVCASYSPWNAQAPRMAPPLVRPGARLTTGVTPVALRMIAWFGPIWLASADDAYGEW